MKKATLIMDRDFAIGQVDPRVYGSFIEHLGRAVYGGIYEPGHPTADAEGFRQDVIDLVRRLQVPIVRYPGGNFVSGFNWEDSVGPREERPRRLDLTWFTTETNEVGLHEFAHWAKKAGSEVMYAINLGTRGADAARNVVEYANHPGGSYWSDLRKKNGEADPLGIRVWCLGNEMDGPWQVGSWERDPRGYGVLAHEASKAMKWIDPRIETMACVSSSPFLNHYPDWDMRALEMCYDSVDYISLHHYHSAPTDMPRALLAGYKAYEDYIRTEIALCDYLRTKLRTKKTMMLALDEYGSMLRPRGEARLGLGGRQTADMFCAFDPERTYVRHDPDDWSTRREPATPNEMLSALGMAGTMLVMLRHADRVRIGCATGGLGCLCRTDREHAWKGASHYPFTQMIRWARGVSLQCQVDCARYDVPGYAIDDMNQYAGFEGVDTVQAAAALDEECGTLTVFAINADLDDAQLLELDARAFEGWTFREHIEMHASSPEIANTYENPNAILPRAVTGTRCEGGVVTAKLEKASWNVLRFEKKTASISNR